MEVCTQEEQEASARNALNTSPQPVSQLPGSQQKNQEVKEMESCGKTVTPLTRKKSKRLAFTCTFPDCQRSYARKNALQIHIRLKHEASMFRCEFEDCGEEFTHRESLEAHQKQHQEEKMIMCDVKNCYRTFTTLEAMERHTQIHSEARAISCIVSGCSLSFSYPKALDSHLERSHPGEITSFICDYSGCGKRFAKFHLLKFHEGIHKDEKIYKCPVNGCDSSFATKYYRNSHVYKCHRAVQKTPCNVCGKRFQVGYRLTRHMETHVEDKLVKARSFLCPDCGKGFTTKDKLKRHASSHSDERPFLCTQCGTSFKRKDNLVKHALIHSDTAPKEHLCSFCGKVLRTKSGLDSHMKSHSSPSVKASGSSQKNKAEDAYVCAEPNCGKTFKNKKYLLDHRVLHYPESHACAMCGKVFKCLRYLRTHLKTHSEERKHPCPVCGKAFKTGKDLSKHEETHEIHRKHICPITECGRAYKTSTCLRLHMKAHKSKGPNGEFRSYKSVSRPVNSSKPVNSESERVSTVPFNHVSMIQAQTNFLNFQPQYRF